MNFYIDFEANQFSNRIISIGCVSDSEQKFFQLCKPSKKGEKITSFITELTGITQEAIDMAKTADEVFVDFFEWADAICECTQETPVFYCYGNSDKDFLKATVRHMTNFTAITMVNSLIASIKDYTKILNLEHPIGLIKLYNFLLASEIKQRHDSLEDAKMLSYIAQNSDKLSCFIKPATTPKATLKIKSNYPEAMAKWVPGSKPFEVDTNADENNYEYKCVNSRGQVKYFDNIDTMVFWFMLFYAVKGRSVKNENDRNNVKQVIENAMKRNEKAYGFNWYRKESDI